MEQAELEQIIEQARIDRVDKLDLRDCEISFLPESIGNLSALTKLDLYNNKLSLFPESINNLTNLTNLNLGSNHLEKLPESINKLNNLTSLFLSGNKLGSLPEQLGDLSNLNRLYLRDNALTELPESMGNCCKLKELYVQKNMLTILPKSISNLCNLIEIYLSDNPWIDLSILKNIPNLKRVYCFGVALSSRYWTYVYNWKAEWILNEENAETRHALIEQIGFEKIIEKLAVFTSDNCHAKNIVFPNEFKLDLARRKLAMLPHDIGKLTYLTELNLSDNQLKCLPESIGNLSNLSTLSLWGNQLNSLPKSIASLSKLRYICLNENPWTDLSSLQKISNLESVSCFGVELPRRYWIKLSNWKANWLLDENNIEIRQRLIAQIGYEKICDDLNAVMLDNWRKYTLLKIDGIEKIYDDEDNDEPIATEPMVLLKMTCPSTQHIHILRVPPAMTSAEAAITWVNHGIHPDEFAVQT